ncbi:MAG: hypothetical protein Q8S73_26650 [Deltaproteobacteria bacterium]|nr:hypothetical protein [Myxococcales bacterium]MDP3217716.1 hypothetical protein [Deltaproteobacteria bacterium]
MRRITTFARGSSVPAATLNAMQDRAVGLTRALVDGVAAPTGTLALTGRDGRYWCTPDTTGVLNGAIAVVDNTRDWKSHHVTATFVRLTAAAQRLHGADVWQRNDPAQAIAVRRIEDAWTGVNVAAITAGTPPVIGAGVFAILLDELSAGANRIFLYARSSDGALCLYNDSGAALHADLFYDGSSASTSDGGASTVPGFLAGDVDTTDATWTTIVTATLAQSSSVTFQGMVSAIRDDGTEGGAFVFSARARRPASGAPVMGATTFTLADFDGTGWDVRVQVSGSDVVVQVQGEAGKNLTWRAEIQTTEASI